MSLLPTPPHSTLTVTSTIPASTTSLAAPRPVVILPGLGNNTGDYKDLVSTLREVYGVPSVVTKVSRVDWLRNAAGLLDPNYWRGTLRPRPVLDWYLERVDEAVAEAKQLLADGYESRAPPKGLPGVIDQTRGLLDYVENNCAPAVYTPELKYICFAGRYIRGARLVGNSKDTTNNLNPVDEEPNDSELIKDNGNKKSLSATPNLRARFIGQGYKQVCGEADVWGDGVVPEVSAHLEGALNISLDGVYHSPVGSDDTTRPWYGSPSVLEKWAHHLLT